MQPEHKQLCIFKDALNCMQLQEAGFELISTCVNILLLYVADVDLIFMWFNLYKWDSPMNPIEAFTVPDRSRAEMGGLGRSHKHETSNCNCTHYGGKKLVLD